MAASCSETSVTVYEFTPFSVPEELKKIYQNGCGKLKSLVN